MTNFNGHSTIIPYMVILLFLFIEHVFSIIIYIYLVLEGKTESALAQNDGETYCQIMHIDVSLVAKHVGKIG